MVRGVLLIGHGTRDPSGTEEFFRLGDELRRRVAPRPFAASLLEFQQPDIPTAWGELVESGVDHIDVAPLLLFAAGHAKQDIPGALARCASETPGVTYRQAGPISRHPAIVDLLLKRLGTARTPRAIDPTGQRTAVLMVGRGSRDPCAQADMRVLGELIARRVDAAAVETAFYAMAEPKFPDRLERLAGSGRYDQVIVQPHLLFTGRIFEAIGREAQGAAQRHPGVRLAVSRYLGPEPAVARAIADRLQADRVHALTP